MLDDYLGPSGPMPRYSDSWSNLGYAGDDTQSDVDNSASEPNRAADFKDATEQHSTLCTYAER
jgi:hypothetical protein